MEIFERKAVRRHWRSLFDEQDGICPLCDQPMDADRPETIHVDHVVAVSKGGSNERSNLQAVHASCNLEKGDFGPWAPDVLNIGLEEWEAECPRCGMNEDAAAMHEVEPGHRVCPICAINDYGALAAMDEASGNGWSSVPVWW